MKKETRGRPRKYKTKKQSTKAIYEQVNASHKKTSTCINVRFHNVNDREVLDKLATVPNKADYIRNLILKDIKQGEQPCFSCYNGLMKTWERAVNIIFGLILIAFAVIGFFVFIKTEVFFRVFGLLIGIPIGCWFIYLGCKK